MEKKKIALFYDADTESGKQILDFLEPFQKRKSDIVGELILYWIAEHGTNVPVQWLNRNKGELGSAKPFFPKVTENNENGQESAMTSIEETQQKDGIPEVEKKIIDPDASLIKAGLASFFA